MRAAAGGLSLATELADFLVERGLPFRQAHEVVGRIVRDCVDRGRDMEAMTAGELAAFSPLLDRHALARLTVESALRRRSSTGGTSPARVEGQLRELESLLGVGRAAGRARR